MGWSEVGATAFGWLVVWTVVAMVIGAAVDRWWHE